jgi:hypothetical protein
MYAGCYFVAGKRLLPLAIKARGRRENRGRGGNRERTVKRGKKTESGRRTKDRKKKCRKKKEESRIGERRDSKKGEGEGPWWKTRRGNQRGMTEEKKKKTAREGKDRGRDEEQETDTGENRIEQRETRIKLREQ